ncbi:MAG: hypothetical protein KJO34_18705 [Deltaproteobacteria bacterium]|nr:hypothetical protein [Deltaproteobacteria bacterium]
MIAWPYRDGDHKTKLRDHVPAGVSGHALKSKVLNPVVGGADMHAAPFHQTPDCNL